jgi:glycerophosphoryl diester phosphodiesterase
LALKEGADGLEFDVRISGDGTPVVIHDPLLDRTTTARGPVREHSADELRRAGVPLVEEVLMRYPDTPLLIELKVAEAAEPVRRLLERHGAASRVVIGSFLDRALQPFRDGRFHTSASRRGIAKLALGALFGWPPGRAVDQAYAVPLRYRNRIPVATARFIAAARRQGCPVLVWTVNEAEEAVRLWGLGASGMITNYPARLIAARSRLSGVPTGPAPGL